MNTQIQEQQARIRKMKVDGADPQIIKVEEAALSDMIETTKVADADAEKRQAALDADIKEREQRVKGAAK